MPSGTGVIASATGIAVVCMMPMFLTGALAVPIRSDLSMSRGALGLAVGVFLGLQALAAPFGRLVDRRGAGVSLRVCSLVTAVAGVAVAAGAHSAVGLTAALGVAGVGNAMAQPAAGAAITRAVAPRRQGIGIGLVQASKPAGGLIAGVVPLLALTFGWRAAFVACAGAAAALSLTVPYLGATTVTGAKGVRPVQRVRGLPLFLFRGATALGFGTTAMFTTFLVESTVSLGWSVAAAGLLLSTAAAIAVLSRMVAGHLVDRGGRWLFEATGGMMVAGSFGLMLLGTRISALVVPAAALVGATAWGYTGLYMLAMTRLQPEAPGSIIGSMVAGGAVGAFAGPPLFGFIAEHVSYGVAWYMASGWLLLAAVGVFAGFRVLNAGRATAPGLG